ncbi:hypothetical protein EV363DRAFT_293648 [Boletus edulis]|nr:hypothetical protein EV363DRAFT_293648 [Boletus edulis]
MPDSHQNVYAKHMLGRHPDYGYPLRMPEPMSTLPPNYQEHGLEIGDVGTVDSDGQFDVLFNIRKNRDNPIHDRHGVPKDFQPVAVLTDDIKSSDNAISSGPIYSHGIKRDETRPDSYEFHTSTSAGAILVLSCDVESVKLSQPEYFREVAMNRALDWFEFAKKRYGGQHFNRSLYLITGFYKTRSWSLASFNNRTDDTGKIWAQRDSSNPNIYLLRSTFSSDCRHGTSRSGHNNQTVFITGFKITVASWLPDPIVLRVTESETVWSILVHLFKACLKRLHGFPGGHKQPATISVEHSPELSQPFHPSDIINRFLLSKNSNAKFAITHDDQWIDMMKEGLTHEDLLQEDRLGTFLARYYNVSIDSKHENSKPSVSKIASHC